MATSLPSSSGLLLLEIKIFQYIVMGLYAHLITSVFFSLYIWCAAADPADPGVFRSKKYLKIPANEKHTRRKDSKLYGESTSSMQDANTVTVVGKLLDKDVLGKEATSKMSTSDSGKKNAPETSSRILISHMIKTYNHQHIVSCCISEAFEFAPIPVNLRGMTYCLK
ncbi:unnamed protein product [Prunus armeniaca]|uniref:Uncharacterized protein n=1 Tax=Prunus armeniaca TaxID=36596 RepID=A0A6J5WRR7_PRUAR|nr:unnamed protein product [Prunus armeniaca]